MDDKKIYLVVLLIRIIYSGMQLIAKAAFNGGMNTFVFVFYRQAFATVFLAPFALIFERKKAPPLPVMVCFKIFVVSLCGICFTLNLYSIGLNYTSATLASAAINSIPVITFILAALFGMETVKLKRLSGIAKVFGIAFCLAGLMTIAFYKGPHLKSLNHHHPIDKGSRYADHTNHSKKTWIVGSFIMIIANTFWSLWIVLQRPLLMEYPSKLLLTTLQCFFSTIQSFFLALCFERDLSQWRLGFDMRLLSVAYCGIIVTGVSYYLQCWCIQKKGPVFLAMSTPLTLVITIACSSLLLGELINLGSVVGGILMVGGLYSVLWGKSKERKENCTPIAEDGKISLEEKEMVSPVHQPCNQIP